MLNAQTGLSPTQKLILIGIANHDGDGGAWPAIATLARYAEVSERTVQRALRDLDKAGVIDIIIGGGGTHRTREDRRPNRYVIHYDGVTQHVTPCDSDGVTSEASRGDIPGTDGVTSRAPRGDIAVSPEPPLNQPEPSENHPWEPTFAEWYENYPKKQGAQNARKRWAKMTHDERVKAWLALAGWQQYALVAGTQFVPMASTWLNQARWEDEPPKPPEPEWRVGPGGNAIRQGMKRAAARSHVHGAIEMINNQPASPLPGRKELNQ
jgi:DNA-binding transcriptional regulator YhcF (GntR family)